MESKSEQTIIIPKGIIKTSQGALIKIPHELKSLSTVIVQPQTVFELKNPDDFIKHKAKQLNCSTTTQCSCKVQHSVYQDATDKTLRICTGNKCVTCVCKDMSKIASAIEDILECVGSLEEMRNDYVQYHDLDQLSNILSQHSNSSCVDKSSKNEEITTTGNQTDIKLMVYSQTPVVTDQVFCVHEATLNINKDAQSPVNVPLQMFNVQTETDFSTIKGVMDDFAFKEDDIEKNKPEILDLSESSSFISSLTDDFDTLLDRKSSINSVPSRISKFDSISSEHNLTRSEDNIVYKETEKESPIINNNATSSVEKQSALTQQETFSSIIVESNNKISKSHKIDGKVLSFKGDHVPIKSATTVNKQKVPAISYEESYDASKNTKAVQISQNLWEHIQLAEESERKTLGENLMRFQEARRQLLIAARDISRCGQAKRKIE